MDYCDRLLKIIFLRQHEELILVALFLSGLFNPFQLEILPFLPELTKMSIHED